MRRCCLLAIRVLTPLHVAHPDLADDGELGNPSAREART